MKKAVLVVLVISIGLLTWVFWPTQPIPPMQDDTEKTEYFAITNSSTEAIDIDIAEPKANNTVPVYWVRYFESVEDYQSYKDKVLTALGNESVASSWQEQGNDFLPIGDADWGVVFFGQIDNQWGSNPDVFPMCVVLSAQVSEWYIPEMQRLLGEELLGLNNDICRMCLSEDVAVWRYMWEEGLTDYERERT
jgi:hypothetical protein